MPFGKRLEDVQQQLAELHQKKEAVMSTG